MLKSFNKQRLIQTLQELAILGEFELVLIGIDRYEGEPHLIRYGNRSLTIMRTNDHVLYFHGVCYGNIGEKISEILHDGYIYHIESDISRWSTLKQSYITKKHSGNKCHYILNCLRRLFSLQQKR